MKDWSQFNRNEVYIFASAVEDFLLNNLISGLSLEDRKKNWCCYVKYLASPKEWYRYYCILHGDILAHTIIENRQSSFQSVITMQCNFPKMVDGFEGHEKEAIIFSTVWNNTGGYNSFLTNKQRRVWLLWGVSIQVKQHELEWERDCCYQGWQVCWVEASCSLFDGLWVGVHCGQETLQRVLMSSLRLVRFCSFLVLHLIVNIFYLSIWGIWQPVMLKWQNMDTHIQLLLTVWASH